MSEHEKDRQEPEPAETSSIPSHHRVIIAAVAAAIGQRAQDRLNTSATHLWTIGEVESTRSAPHSGWSAASAFRSLGTWSYHAGETHEASSHG